MTNLLIDGNEFTGQTFEGAQPGDNGFATQFDVGNNVPRQLVTIGGNGQNASSVTFTNNTVSGTPAAPMPAASRAIPWSPSMR